MKLLKIISLFITFLFLSWAISCSDTSFLSSKEKKYLATQDSIKVAVFPYYPPYQFTNDQGEMDGIYVDFLEFGFDNCLLQRIQIYENKKLLLD